MLKLKIDPDINQILNQDKILKQGSQQSTAPKQRAQEHKVDHVQREHMDDLQHIQTQQRLLASRTLSPLRSRLGTALANGLAGLNEELEGNSLIRRRQQGQPGERGKKDGEASEQPESAFATSSPTGVDSPEAGAFANQFISGVNALADTQSVETAPRDAQIPSIQEDQQLSTLVSSSQPSWVWMLSQLLKTDLQRLGVEPDELNDIRVLLIKNEATKYEKLARLSRLPASLAPEAVTKIFDDVRTIAAAYVTYMMLERAKQEEELEEDMKQMAEFPGSVVSSFVGVKTIEFDPEEELRKLG